MRKKKGSTFLLKELFAITANLGTSQRQQIDLLWMRIILHQLEFIQTTKCIFPNCQIVQIAKRSC